MSFRVEVACVGAVAERVCLRRMTAKWLPVEFRVDDNDSKGPLQFS